MAERAWNRARQLEEANRREDAWLPQTHPHGTMTACPCGAETGVTTSFAIFIDGYVPDHCLTCGKPASAQGDSQPYREVPKHVIGCPERPDTARCTVCRRPFLGTMLVTEKGAYHLGCDSPASGRS
jgi:hypothetical protein